MIDGDKFFKTEVLEKIDVLKSPDNSESHHPFKTHVAYDQDKGHLVERGQPKAGKVK